MTIDVHQLDSFLLVGSAVTFLAILAARVSSRVGLPSLLIYLLMGVVMGEAGMGIEFENYELTHALGFLALAIILAEGGLTTDWQEVKPSMPLGAVLATVGVVVSVGNRRGRRGTTCWACPGCSRSCSVRSPRRPMLRRSSRCSASYPFRLASSVLSRPSRA